ncbi:uncharacterized protein LOC113170885 [Anabas testudineus]|uniref:uncharacterized protein LOC113170885 n=1 Tax=Anabas testudineus TaxID=64144 RepID=UPI000E4568B2|nr:uncharacterized protein LOC113170885 [Anabas testudineus]
MISMCMMIFALAAAALAKTSTECNFSESTETLQCFGLVGQLLLFHLPNTANTEIKLIKDNKYLILRRIKNEIVTLNEEYADSQTQSELLTRGTLNFGEAKKRHSGEYTLEEFDSKGALVKKVIGQLEIQAQVSAPAMSQTCLSHEQMKVKCSSEGDGVEFSLRLDNELLIHIRDQSVTPSNWAENILSMVQNTAKQDKSSVSDVVIGLHGQRTGNLTCKVWNKVSKHETAIYLTGCKDFTSFPAVTVAVKAGVFTLLLLVALYLGRKKLCNKPRPPTVHERNSENEIIYTNAKVQRHEENQPQLT